MAEAIPDPLSDKQVKFARILWCDNANVIRAKAIHGMRIRPHSWSGAFRCWGFDNRIRSAGSPFPDPVI